MFKQPKFDNEVESMQNKDAAGDSNQSSGILDSLEISVCSSLTKAAVEIEDLRAKLDQASKQNDDLKRENKEHSKKVEELERAKGSQRLIIADLFTQLKQEMILQTSTDQLKSNEVQPNILYAMINAFMYPFSDT